MQSDEYYRKYYHYYSLAYFRILENQIAPIIFTDIIVWIKRGGFLL